jgi:hypothetical protein
MLTWQLQQSACAIAGFNCTDNLWHQVLAKLAVALLEDAHANIASRKTVKAYKV